MNTILTLLIGLAIGGWFLYYLAGGFDYKSAAPVKPSEMKRQEIVTDTGHLIIVDEEAAKRRRERIWKMMEGK